MPRCLSCNTDNPEGFRFCGQCGRPLAQAECPACGAANAPGQAYCGQCGSVLDGAVVRAGQAAVEERKLATVLFADVVGFTSLAERTDPELVARMVDAAFRRLGDVVDQHGGTVDKYMGDSVMAVFGVPVAHDDDAERAVAAGLAMRELRGDLAFSIGINSGEVMATAVGGTSDVTVIGDTVNVAARLEKAAGPGEVLCGQLTAELAGRRVVFRERQPVLLKGKREPVEVWEAVSLRRADDDVAAAEGPALVGRDDELAFLEAQWRRARRDHRGHVVLLCGEAGSGKTRLVDELADLVATDGTVVRTSYPGYGALGGARVAADVLRQLGPAGDPDVDARVRSLAGDIDPSLQAIDPTAMRQEQMWAFGRLLQEKAAERPVLLVIDDMHRSGPRTLELVGDLAGRLGNAAVLTVLAGRTDPDDWLTRFPTATTVRLGPLSRSDAAALAGAFVCDKPLAADAAEFFAGRANGNPLYIRELVSMARARHALVDHGDRYGLTADAAIPATLQALLAARLDALDPDHKLVLQHVAVLGEAATPDQVVGLGAPEAATGLRSLADDGLLRVSDDGTYDAVDALLREVAYETLPRNLRGDLHRRAAGVVARPEVRARHLERAVGYLADDDALTAEAAEALAQAGEEFVRVSRHLEGIRLLERAVALGCLRPDALLTLAQAQSLSGQPDDALQTLTLIPDDPGDPALAVERDHTAANTKSFSDPAWALPRLRQVADRWRELGSTSKEAWARANAGVASFNLSRMEEAAVQLEEALGLFENAGDRAGAVSASSFLCLVKPTDRRVSGWLADALEFGDAAGDKSRQITTLSTLMWHHFFTSFCGTAEDAASCEGFALRLAELAGELGANDIAVQGRSLLAVTARWTGRLAEATDQASELQQAEEGISHSEPWLGWAASFAVTVATGASGAAPPFPPEGSLDPVVAMAGLVIEAELTLAGRLDEALSRQEGDLGPDLGPIGDLAGVVHALTLVLAGRHDDARRVLQRAARAARAMDATQAQRAIDAMLSELDGDTSRLAPAPPSARSISDALVLRAHAVAGDAAALAALHRCAGTFGAPGLLTRL